MVVLAFVVMAGAFILGAPLERSMSVTLKEIPGPPSSASLASSAVVVRLQVTGGTLNSTEIRVHTEQAFVQAVPPRCEPTSPSREPVTDLSCRLGPVPAPGTSLTIHLLVWQRPDTPHPSVQVVARGDGFPASRNRADLHTAP